MLPGGFEIVQKLLRNTVEGPANRCGVEIGERNPRIAVPCQLGIERDGPETGR